MFPKLACDWPNPPPLPKGLLKAGDEAGVLLPKAEVLPKAGVLGVEPKRPPG